MLEEFMWFLIIQEKNLSLHCSLTKSKFIKTILPGIHNFNKDKNDIYQGGNYIWKSALGSWNRGIILISLLVGGDSASLQVPCDSRAFISLSFQDLDVQVCFKSWW